VPIRLIVRGREGRPNKKAAELSGGDVDPKPVRRRPVVKKKARRSR
jgi:hypothetical protein